MAETGSTVKVIYDETTADTYARTRLRDGAGTLGVTVRAQGREQYLAAQGSDYTGPTDVESGTLVVHGKTVPEVTCSYIKIAPKKVPDTDNYYNCYWGMNEFKIYDVSGNEISLKGLSPVSSTGAFINDSSIGANLLDDNVKTRMLPKGGSKTDMPTVLITLPQPITFAAYDWYSDVDGTKPLKYRYPLDLEIWVSSDNVNWMLADKRTNAQPSTDDDYKKWQGGENHFILNFGTMTDLPTLDASVCGASSEGASFVECVKARYFRFTCFEMFNSWHFRDAKEYSDRGWSMSELSLKRNGEFVDWPTNNADFAVSNGGGLSLWNAGGSVTARIADNIRSKDASGGENRVLYTNALGYVQIDAGELLEFDAYSLWTPPYGSGRLPRGWMLQVSVNGTNWHTIDVHRPAEGDKGRLPSTAYREYGPFSLKNRWPIAGAGNVIGDKSKVTVKEGATLRLDAASEYVGGLAGEGTVNLRGHTLGLLAQDTNTVFSGAVEGAGTLVISGEGEQAFEGADLSGVSTLKLAGGAMTGSASFGGSDLSLDFAGGALGASLLNVGTLTVTGDVVIRPPAAVIAARKNWTATITTGTAMDAGTQEAFENAQFIGLPRSMKPSIEVEDTCVTFTIVRSGLVFVIR